jgi:hypothetical protein
VIVDSPSIALSTRDASTRERWARTALVRVRFGCGTSCAANRRSTSCSRRPTRTRTES